MITLFGQTYAWNSPEMLLLGGAALVLLAFLILILRAAARASSSAEPLMREVSGATGRNDWPGACTMSPKRKLSARPRCSRSWNSAWPKCSAR
jgi:hypothetical protein